MPTMQALLSRIDRLERALARLAPETDESAAIARLRDRLETMAARLRESADWQEPTPAELADVRVMMAAYRAGGAA
jgi:putative hemolysin